MVVVLLYPICRWFSELKETVADGGGLICEAAVCLKTNRILEKAVDGNSSFGPLCESWETAGI